MKALVIAERADAARELCAGARTMADEVVLVSFGEAPEAVADKIARISVPEGTVLIYNGCRGAVQGHMGQVAGHERTVGQKRKRNRNG